jgi:ribonuclease HII
MVMAGVVVTPEQAEQLRNMGVKDSKLIPPAKREDMFEVIKKIVTSYKIIILSPQEIDNALNSPDSNLNKLEGVATAQIINELKPEKAILDCPSTNIEAYEEFVKEMVEDKNVKFVTEHKADLNYIEPGAASILAKVTRDNEIDKLRKIYGETGPGYPANPITQAFLKKNWKKHPELFRQTWATYKRIAKAEAQKNLGDY